MRARFSFWQARPRHGQTIVLFALMSLVLIAGMGLVIDAGVDYAQRRIMQNAADLAALAGARAIAQQLVSPSTPNVRDAVETAAVANGVNLANVQCSFIDDSRNILGACNNTTLSLSTTGVRVRVLEQHTTFFMRAIGITTSGTAATSMAQVQQANLQLTSDTLMAVCGVQTKTTAGTNVSILETSMQIDNLAPPPSPSASPSMIPMATNPTQIRDDVYSYDWNKRDSSGQFVPEASPRPEFVIEGANIAKCRKPGTWYGLFDYDTESVAIEILSGLNIDAATFNTHPSPLPDSTGITPTGATCNTTQPTRYGPCHPINGPMGCDRGVNPTSGCIMVLPITDNYMENGADNRLFFRAWGAFQVTKVGSEYRGRLIKNYPMHSDSSATWDRTYTGPISITLIGDD